VDAGIKTVGFTGFFVGGMYWGVLGVTDGRRDGVCVAVGMFVSVGMTTSVIVGIGESVGEFVGDGVSVYNAGRNGVFEGSTNTTGLIFAAASITTGIEPVTSEQPSRKMADAKRKNRRAAIGRRMTSLHDNGHTHV
jgi:hypothetical protein